MTQHTTELPTGAHPVSAATSADTTRRRPYLRVVGLLVGLALLAALPWMVYPPLAVDIVTWGLFAISIDLLLGYTGLLSFGHAAFWGASAYITGMVAIESGAPFPVAILVGVVTAMIIAVPTGWLAVRSIGIYFAMVTLAFAQMLYFVATQAQDYTGGENGLQGVPKNFFGVGLVESEPFYFYYAVLPLILLGLWVAWRVVHSPFGRVLLAVRDNPARARAMGYDVEKYKIMIFVVSAGIAGLAGGIYVISHGFASLNELLWTTSGKGVLIAVLGGIGTIWGSLVGAVVLVSLEDYLASSGFEGTGIITGAIFVLVVLLFRRGIWGSLSHYLPMAMRRLTGRSRRGS